MTEDYTSDSLWPESLCQYDVTLKTPAENLALDEVLLTAVEAAPQAASLRFWESPDYCVVLGRSNRVEAEVNVEACQQERIPILRRTSGGGAVLVGPGCLCYTLALPLTTRLRSLGISNVTAALMTRIADSIGRLLPAVTVRGTSDLVWNERKLSGNAQRWLRQSFVHHGTILYQFDIPRLQRALNHPSREPVYRAYRSHSEFLTHVPLESNALKSAIGMAWNVCPATCPSDMLDEAVTIAETRYASNDWHL